MAKIEVRNIYKIFGPNPEQVLPKVQAGSNKEEILEETGHTVGLDDVSISIEEGETFVCMGLSGSGKSTLIRHINRLIDPTSGEVFVEGTDVLKLNQIDLLEFRKQTMSMVFQRFGLFPHKTVVDMWLMDLKFKKWNQKREIKLLWIKLMQWDFLVLKISIQVNFQEGCNKE